VYGWIASVAHGPPATRLLVGIIGNCWTNDRFTPAAWICFFRAVTFLLGKSPADAILASGWRFMRPEAHACGTVPRGPRGTLGLENVENQEACASFARLRQGPCATVL
jgi:hypothetical protein